MNSIERRRLYAVLILVAVGFATARTVNVEAVNEPSVHKNYGRKWPTETPQPWPSFSSNDRSRWATVRSLVEEGTFVIGRRDADPAFPSNPDKYVDSGILFEDGFKSVDVVLHPDRREFFATKPPLLTLLAAGEYWVIHKATGWKMAEHRWEIIVPILLTLNILPLAIGLWLISRLVEAYGTTDWGRLFTMACACFGTFLPTFAIALNNHTLAAFCITVAVYALLAPHRADSAVSTGFPVTTWSPLRLITCGFCSGFAMCLDLPAAAFGGAVAFVVLLQQTRGLVWLLPALVAAPVAQLVLSHQVYGIWEPIYAKFGGPWYEYPGSHWMKKYLPVAEGARPGIDFINEPKGTYAFHLLVGHHGLFSLTPIWLLSLFGFFGLSAGSADRARIFRWLAPMIVAVVVGFYIVKTNNYGGWTCGPRWLFWLTPILLWAMIPAADRMADLRILRGLGLLFLGVSAFSTMYPFANPWRHPWILQWCDHMGWIRY